MVEEEQGTKMGNIYDVYNILYENRYKTPYIFTLLNLNVT